MDDEIQLISDGEGLAVIGEPGAVERFLESENLPSKDLGLPRLSRVLSQTSGGLQAGSELAANSGRWVKLTEESARKLKDVGLVDTDTPGVKHLMLGKRGDIKGWLQITTRPSSLASNPAVLAGAAGMMAQFAMQQTMDEITDYLARIDEKLDDVLRAQKNAVLAQLIGVGFQIDEAMKLRAHVGSVNEVTWSKVQTTSGTVAEVQAYALLQLDGLAERLEGKTKLGHLAESTKGVEARTREWLAVLARTFQLQDAIAILELDRVFETALHDLDGHRVGLRAARQERLEAISTSTDGLLAHIGVAAGLANDKVLLHPSRSPEVARTGAEVLDVVSEFHDRLGIENTREPLETRRWSEAAGDVSNTARHATADGFRVARTRGSNVAVRANEVGGRLSHQAVARARDLRRSLKSDEDS